jgi:hypothetical protein
MLIAWRAGMPSLDGGPDVGEEEKAGDGTGQCGRRGDMGQDSPSGDANHNENRGVQRKYQAQPRGREEWDDFILR